jgi:hypothetical protein
VYTLIMFLFQDRVKLLAYRIFRPEASGILVKETPRAEPACPGS